MNNDSFLFKSAAGVDWHLTEEDDGKLNVGYQQNVDAIIEKCTAMRNHGDSGYSEDKTFRRVGSVPMMLLDQWRQQYGMDMRDPEWAKLVIKQLNSSDFYKLRTAEFIA